MALLWKKLGKTVWYGEEGSWRYTINAKPFPLGGTRYYVTRGGIAHGVHFASCSSLPRAKAMAHDDMIERESRILALPNHGDARP